MPTTPYVFVPEQSQLLARVGTDVVARVGLTTRGTIGVRTARTLDDRVREVAAIAEEKAALPDFLALCQGGPITEPTDAQYLLDQVPGLDGFYGASSMERLSTELPSRGRSATSLD